VQRGASPGAAKAIRLMNTEIDVRDLLPTISVPTLVLHRSNESWKEEVGPDRVLATLLFAYIVGSAAKAAELGDHAWDDLLSKHQRFVRAQFTRFRGREIEQADGHVSGTAVDVAAQIAATARPGDVLVSGTVKDIVAGSGIAFEERGEHELKGGLGSWRLFAASA
jgi:class 3 adenylate cyclase